MNSPASMARENASHCEAKKHALRQTQDGIVVSFVLHPNDVPPSLQLAPLGTRYMLALVEIADDETPVTGKEEQPSSRAPESKPAPPPDHTARAPRKWEDITPAQQAGIRCNEPAFVKFLEEYFGYEIKTTEKASEFVRRYCGVESRSDIRDGVALAEWNRLEGKYKAWQLAPRAGVI